MSGPAPSASPGTGYRLFDTPIGRCAIAWRGAAIVGSALPDASDDSLRRTMIRRFPGAAEASSSPVAEAAIAAIVALLNGEAEDFSSVPINLGGLPEFERGVLEETRRIPMGETRTYGELATAIGAPGAARAVGGALGRNPIPIIVPCHRVLAAGGGGGFSAPGGLTTKIRILEIERARRSCDAGLFERLPFAVKPAPARTDRPNRAR